MAVMVCNVSTEEKLNPISQSVIHTTTARQRTLSSVYKTLSVTDVQLSSTVANGQHPKSPVPMQPKVAKLPPSDTDT